MKCILSEAQLRKLIEDSAKSALDEGSLIMNDDELKKLASEKLQAAHTALNNLLMPLFVNSQKSEFAKRLFTAIKQADDTILMARKDFWQWLIFVWHESKVRNSHGDIGTIENNEA